MTLNLYILLTNLIYTYKTDCLEANFEYNKKYYSDGSVQPDQSIFFTLKYILKIKFYIREN